MEGSFSSRAFPLDGPALQNTHAGNELVGGSSVTPEEYFLKGECGGLSFAHLPHSLLRTLTASAPPLTLLSLERVSLLLGVKALKIRHICYLQNL